MREAVKQEFQKVRNYAVIFMKWLACAILLGMAVGGVAIAFDYAVYYATAARQMYGFLLFLLPVGGVAIVLAYRLCGMEKDRGTNLVLMAVHSTERISIKTAPLIFFATVVTHVFGGSSGREGAALQLGGSLGAQAGRMLHMNDTDGRLMTMCGMSAAFSALFGTPVAAAVFSMEVISVGIMHYAALVPCVISAFVAFWLAGLCGVVPTRYTLTAIPDATLLTAGKVLLLALLCAVVSIVFCRVLRLAGSLYVRFIPNAFLRAAVGGVLVVAVTLLLGTRDYNGAGMDVIARALNGQARPEAFALKILLTALTLGAGYKGGEIVPTLFVGATFGNTMGGLLGLSPSFGAAIGMTALFCGVTNCPLTALLLSVELFGAQGLLLFAVATAVSYMLSGYTGLYTEQKIVYSKFRTEFIDRKVQ